MRSWTALAARRGAGRHRRLVVLVLVVQLAAIALGSAFPALLAAAEEHGVREALAASSDTGLTVIADRPVGSVAATVGGVRRAADRVLGDAATAVPTVAAVSVAGSATGPDGRTQPYLGELPDAARAITVVAGTWPAAGPEAGTVPVAVPQAAATALGASLGQRLRLRIDGRPVRVRVAAVYRAVDQQGPAWAVDPLSGAGNDASHVDPFDPYAPPVDLAGPLLISPGTLDRLGITPSRVDVACAPDFSATTVGALVGLDARLSSIEQDLPVDTGRIAETVTPQTVLGGVVDGVLAQLLITRTIAAIAGLLLVVLAMVVLVQAAVLLDAERAEERALLAARGASPGQLVGLAAWEAAGAAVVAVVVGVPLGAGVASLVRGEPVPPPAASWLVGVAIALVVVGVRLLPRLRPAARHAGRLRRGTGIMRSGADLVLVAVAVLLGWQLAVRRVDTAAGVDPVLVVAPAALVLAGALVALRLVPLVGRLGEVVAHRAAGAVAALAGWELSRRSSRATATVLLVTLAVATGVLGAVSEATWTRSQLDQAQLAVGAPVRVPADQAALARQSALLASGTSEAPQPALRRTASVQPDLGGVADPSEDDALTDAVVLGLTAPARAMLDRGRLAAEGGATIGRLRPSAPAVSGARLPAGATTLQLRVRVGEPARAVRGAAAALHGVLEGADGLLTTVDLGAASVDGKVHVVRGRVPAPGMRLVGLQVQVLAADPVKYVGSPAMTIPLRVLRIAAGATTVAVPGGWSAIGASGDLRQGLTIPLEADLRQHPAQVGVVGWTPVAALRGVWSRHLAAALRTAGGGRFALAFGDVLVPVDVAGVVDRVPGSGARPASAPERDVVVVDQRSLSLMLLQAGDVLPQADEWWVAPAEVGPYLAAHAHAAGGAGADAAVAIADRLTSGPLRVATTQSLVLLVVAAAALGLLGFGVDVVASLDARRRELAQLRAIGLRRGVLERLLTAESTARVAIGAVLGLALGLLIGALAAPRLVVGPEGGAPVPAPLVALPWLPLVLLVAGAVVASLVASLLITRTFRGIDPARILREGDA